jgi:hypothetical protein
MSRYESSSNYDNDHRVRGADRRWWKSLDESRMVATIDLETDDGTVEEEVPFTFEVCSTCNGKGNHVNPSVDCDGLTAEDFAEDPDFLESYMEGAYDVQCKECQGKRVVPVINEEHADPSIIKQLHQKQKDADNYRREVEAERRFGC